MANENNARGSSNRLATGMQRRASNGWDSGSNSAYTQAINKTTQQGLQNGGFNEFGYRRALRDNLSNATDANGLGKLTGNMILGQNGEFNGSDIVGALAGADKDFIDTLAGGVKWVGDSLIGGDLDQDKIAQGLDMAAYFVPGYGVVHGLLDSSDEMFSAMTGYDPVTGEDLTDGERIMNGIEGFGGAALSLIPGIGALRAAGKMAKPLSGELKGLGKKAGDLYYKGDGKNALAIANEEGAIQNTATKGADRFGELARTDKGDEAIGKMEEAQGAVKTAQDDRIAIAKTAQEEIDKATLARDEALAELKKAQSTYDNNLRMRPAKADSEQKNAIVESLIIPGKFTKEGKQAIKRGPGRSRDKYDQAVSERDAAAEAYEQARKRYDDLLGKRQGKADAEAKITETQNAQNGLIADADARISEALQRQAEINKQYEAIAEAAKRGATDEIKALRDFSNTREAAGRLSGNAYRGLTEEQAVKNIANTISKGGNFTESERQLLIDYLGKLDDEAFKAFKKDVTRADFNPAKRANGIQGYLNALAGKTPSMYGRRMLNNNGVGAGTGNDIRRVLMNEGMGDAKAVPTVLPVLGNSIRDLLTSLNYGNTASSNVDKE